MKIHILKGLFVIDLNTILSIILLITSISRLTYASPIIPSQPHHHQQHQAISSMSYSSSSSSSSLPLPSSSSSLESSPFYPSAYSRPAYASEDETGPVHSQLIKSADEEALPPPKRASLEPNVGQEEKGNSQVTATNSDLTSESSSDDSNDRRGSVYTTANAHGGGYGNHHMIAELQRFLTKLDSHVKLAGRPRYGRSVTSSSFVTLLPSKESNSIKSKIPSG